MRWLAGWASSIACPTPIGVEVGPHPIEGQGSLVHAVVGVRLVCVAVAGVELQHHANRVGCFQQRLGLGGY